MKQIALKWDDALIAQIDAAAEELDLSRTKYLQHAVESFLAGVVASKAILAHEPDPQLLAENHKLIEVVEHMATEIAALKRATAKANTVNRPTSAATRARANAATVVAPSPMFKPSPISVIRKKRTRSPEQDACVHPKAKERHIGFAIKCGDCGLVLR